jgi:tRNA threonylcarbamoyladenosine biosynthesis protein TsaB
MIVLAIDTCEARGSVAVVRGDTILQVVPHASAEEYSSWLLPAVDAGLNAAKTTLAEVDVFAAASGPGSFTGVRIGLTTVKAWSEVFGKPIVAVSRLEAVAAQFEINFPYVASFIDAQHGQIFGALYKTAQNGLTLIEPEMAAPPEVFMDWVAERAVGNAVAWVSTDPDVLGDQTPSQGRTPPREKIQCVPCILAPVIGKMAFHRALHGEVQDALSVDANYVRRSYVEVFQKGPAHASEK